MKFRSQNPHQPASIDSDANLPLGEDVYRRLRRLIVDGELAPGAILRQADLVRRFGVSRTPVRDALRRLQAEGLLRPTPTGGYVVDEITSEDVTDVFEVHSALEQLAARLAAERRSRVDLARLEDALDSAEAALERGDLTAVAAESVRFHEALARASQNQYLEEVLAKVHEVYRRFWIRPVSGRDDWAQDLAEDRDLLEAVRVADADTAERCMKYKMHRVLSLRMRALTQDRPVRSGA